MNAILSLGDNRVSKTFDRKIPTSPCGFPASGRSNMLCVGGTGTTPPSKRLYIIDANNKNQRSAVGPGLAPTGGITGARFSSDGRYIAEGHTSTTPYLQIYEIADGAFGRKLGNPASLPTTDCRLAVWSPNNNFLACAHSASPYVTVYPWANGVLGDKLADPSTLPNNAVTWVDWSPDGNYLAVAISGTVPGVYVYKWTDGNFGTRLADIPTLALASCTAVGWSPDGRYLAVAGASNAPPALVFPFDKTTETFGTAVATPNIGSETNCTVIQWSPDGKYIAIGFASASGQTVIQNPVFYRWGDCFGPPIRTPDKMFPKGQTITVREIRWTADMSAVAICYSGTGSVATAVYDWIDGVGPRWGAAVGLGLISQSTCDWVAL